MDIKETGADGIELGYKISLESLQRIKPLLQELKIPVSSVHNFCPLPDDGPSPRHPSNYYRLSALDDNERQRAVAWTKKAVDTAAELQAAVVVIHAGTVETGDDLCERMLKFCKQQQGNLQEFRQVRDRFLQLRRENQPVFFKAVRQSLSEILPYARQNGIKIGLETRYYPTEIPNFDEAGELLSLFHAQGLYYWHDVGHAEVNDRLGITPHLDFLNVYRDQTIGFHLHGVESVTDHLAPFTGDFDLTKVFPFFRPGHIKVIESHGQATREQISRAVARLKGL